MNTTKNKKQKTKNKKGFTLIEILIVLSFISIISIFGIAGFVGFSRTQKLSSATLDVATLLQTAKSRSLSQVKAGSGSCAVNVLDGYQVEINTTNSTYLLQERCGGVVDTSIIQTKTLPTNISFSLPSGASLVTLFFNVLTGTVSGASSNGYPITVTNSENNSSKTITVYTDGRIVVN